MREEKYNMSSYNVINNPLFGTISTTIQIEFNPFRFRILKSMKWIEYNNRLENRSRLTKIYMK